MEKQKYAFYVEGKNEPIGILRESTLRAVDEIFQITGKNYRTEPVSDERAKEITDSITRLSPELEKLFSKP
jgi:hypothetical protein